MIHSPLQKEIQGPLKARFFIDFQESWYGLFEVSACPYEGTTVEEEAQRFINDEHDGEELTEDRFIDRELYSFDFNLAGDGVKEYYECIKCQRLAWKYQGRCGHCFSVECWERHQG